jgi:hypothetical protein
VPPTSLAINKTQRPSLMNLSLLPYRIGIFRWTY